MAHNRVVAIWKDVERIAATLPDTVETTPRNWRVRKKLMVWERPLRKADYAALGDDAPDGDILGARVADEGVKFALIADSPGVYFTTPHFDGYPMVLVRLAEIGVPELAELDNKAIHWPFQTDGTRTLETPGEYNDPIVIHQHQKEKVLALFKQS